MYIDGAFEYHKLESTSTLEKNETFIIDGRSRIASIRVGDSFPNDIDTEYYVLEDHLGSGMLRLKATVGGTVLDREEYYPFGDSSLRTWTKKRYQYVGKEKDQESGLYYYGARYYAAWTCRFISVDPLAAKYPSINPYLYAYNNPIRANDPTGMEGEEGNQENSNTQSNNLDGSLQTLEFKKDREGSFEVSDDLTTNAGDKMNLTLLSSNKENQSTTGNPSKEPPKMEGYISSIYDFIGDREGSKINDPRVITIRYQPEENPSPKQEGKFYGKHTNRGVIMNSLSLNKDKLGEWFFAQYQADTRENSYHYFLVKRNPLRPIKPIPLRTLDDSINSLQPRLITKPYTNMPRRIQHLGSDWPLSNRGHLSLVDLNSFLFWNPNANISVRGNYNAPLGTTVRGVITGQNIADNRANTVVNAINRIMNLTRTPVNILVVPSNTGTSNTIINQL